MYVCLSVTGLQLKYTALCIEYVPLARAAQDAIARWRWHGDQGRGLEGQKTTPERVQMYGRQLTAQQKNERRQDNGDKKRLAHHHPSDLLCSLSRERIGGGQHGVVSPASRASPL